MMVVNSATTCNEHSIYAALELSKNSWIVNILPGVPEDMGDLEFPEDQTLPLQLSPWWHHLED